jgi:hypothetical protein
MYIARPPFVPVSLSQFTPIDGSAAALPRVSGPAAGAVKF